MKSASGADGKPFYLHEVGDSCKVVASQTSFRCNSLMSLSPDWASRLESEPVRYQPGTGRYKYQHIDFPHSAAAHLQGAIHGSVDDGNKFAVRVLDVKFHYFDG